jgi:hypothetical protein
LMLTSPRLNGARSVPTYLGPNRGGDRKTGSRSKPKASRDAAGHGFVLGRARHANFLRLVLNAVCWAKRIHWIKVKNRKHPAMQRVMDSF